MTVMHGLSFGPRRFLDEMRNELESQRYERISLRPLAATVGAEISGADLSALDDATFAEVHQAFLDYKVVFFRDQDLTTEAHMAFARRFGDLEEHPFLPPGQVDEVVRFEKGEEV